MGSIFIDDGFTLQGKITELRGVHPEIHFTYRPAMPVRAYAFASSRLNRTPEEQLEETAKLLAEHVTDWDARDRVGNVLPRDVRTFKGIYARALDQMLDAVLGYSPAARSEDEKK